MISRKVVRGWTKTVVVEMESRGEIWQKLKYKGQNLLPEHLVEGWEGAQGDPEVADREGLPTMVKNKRPHRLKGGGDAFS